MIRWHAFNYWLRSRETIARIGLAVMSLGVIAVPIFAAGWKWGVSYTAAWIGVGMIKAYRELSPRMMQLYRRNYLERKLKLHRLIQKMRRPLCAAEILPFQREALQLIALYVRDHRQDTHGTEIFANLLVEDGDDLRVVARETEGRPLNVKYAKDSMLAWMAMQTGQIAVTGDVYADFPETPRDKKYLSIIAIPVVVDSEEGQRTLGVVSIDSPRRYHFDGDKSNLERYLMPYVALLAWTLEQTREQT